MITRTVAVCALALSLFFAGSPARAEWQVAKGFAKTAKHIGKLTTIGGRVYALGDVVQWSDDAGATWRAAKKGTPKLTQLAAFGGQLYGIEDHGDVYVAPTIAGPWKLAFSAGNLGFDAGLEALAEGLWVFGLTGLFRSTDGVRWVGVSLGAPDQRFAVSSLAFETGRLHAFAKADSKGIPQLFTSSDGGARWSLSTVDLGFYEWDRARLFARDGALIAATTQKITRSVDGGVSWIQTWQGNGTGVYANPYADAAAGAFHAGDRFGGSLSVDGGASWLTVSTPQMMDGPVATVADHKGTRYVVAASFRSDAQHPMSIVRRPLKELLSGAIGEGRTAVCAALPAHLKLRVGKSYPSLEDVRFCSETITADFIDCLLGARDSASADACWE